MESYHQAETAVLNVEEETAVFNGGAAALESRNEPERTLQYYIGQLETLLGRTWSEGDMIRTRACLTAIWDPYFSLEDLVANEIEYLRGETQEPEQLAVTLLGYYRLFLAAWSVATEVHSVRLPETEMETETEDHSDSWEAYLEYFATDREALEEEMEDAMEIINSSMDVESERSGGRPYEEIVLEQLKTRNFDQEARHEDEEEICSVCLQDLYRGTVAALNCRHEFHVDCIMRWLDVGRNVCPLCRATAIRH